MRYNQTTPRNNAPNPKKTTATDQYHHSMLQLLARQSAAIPPHPVPRKIDNFLIHSTIERILFRDSLTRTGSRLLVERRGRRRWGEGGGGRRGGWGRMDVDSERAGDSTSDWGRVGISRSTTMLFVIVFGQLSGPGRGREFEGQREDSQCGSDSSYFRLVRSGGRTCRRRTTTTRSVSMTRGDLS